LDLGGAVSERVERLAALLGELRPQSLAALEHALSVASIDGVEGTLVIKVPRKSSDPADVSFVTGRARLSME
jgi:hypothetical protein